MGSKDGHVFPIQRTGSREVTGSITTETFNSAPNGLILLVSPYMDYPMMHVDLFPFQKVGSYEITMSALLKGASPLQKCHILAFLLERVSTIHVLVR